MERQAIGDIKVTTNLDEAGFDQGAKERVEGAVKRAIASINEAVQRGAAASASAQKLTVKDVTTTVGISTTQPTTSGGSGSVTGNATVTISFGKK